MNIRAYIVDARRTIISNKLRSGLSSLGIIIGVSSVVILLSIGAGFKQQLSKSMGDMASNSISIMMKDYGVSPLAVKLPLNQDTISFLESTFHELQGRIIGRIYIPLKSEIHYGSKSTQANINGITNNYFELSKLPFIYGTGFSQDDWDNKKNVVVLSYSALEKLFDNQDPVGKTLLIKGKLFTVAGILDKRSQDAWGSEYIDFFVPFSTATENLTNMKEYEQLTINLQNGADNDQWRYMIHYALLKYIGVSTKEDGKFEVSSFVNFIKEIEGTIKAFTYFLGVIGGISLLVGGIGVMNIMIVSVTERTREIGIRKAIGALKRDIILQFLTESVLITFLGGVIAIIISGGIILLINKLITAFGEGSSLVQGLQLSMTPQVVLMAFGLTTFTGIAFGILPARKAMKLKPIDALRFE